MGVARPVIMVMLAHEIPLKMASRPLPIIWVYINHTVIQFSADSALNCSNVSQFSYNEHTFKWEPQQLWNTKSYICYIIY